MRTKKFLKKLLLIIAVLYAPLQSLAWGAQGHRVCGQIAGMYLTPKARRAVDAILGGESLAQAGTWADFIKSDPAYNYLSSWHYIDFDRQYTYPEMVQYLNHDTRVDAYTKLQFLLSELKKNNLSKQNKLLYLHMLIHIVEDVHQPMHAAHADDKGGNDFKVNWFSTPSNLHAVWDWQLIEFQHLSDARYAAAINHSTPAQCSEWQQAPIAQWLFESNRVAEKLYAEIKPGQTLSYKYNYTHIGTLNRQLLKAGVRLAGVLNALFG